MHIASSLSSVAKLRLALNEIEQALSLHELSATERDVLYAFCLSADEERSVADSETVRQQALAAPVAHATFYRAVSKLLDLGLLMKSGGYKTKRYFVSNLARNPESSQAA